MNRSIQYCPDYAVFYNELGGEYERLGQFKKAADFYQKALEKNPRLTGIYAVLGRSFAKSGRYAEAIGSFKRFLKSDPENLSAYYWIAACDDKINKNEEAAQLRREAQKKSFELARKYRMMGDKFKETDKLKEAIVSYKKSLGFVRDLSLDNDLGCLYILDNDLKQAEKLFQQVLLADPSNAVIHNNLALVYYYRKRYDLAISHCDKAIELGYQVNPEFLSWLKMYRKDKKRKNLK